MALTCVLYGLGVEVNVPLAPLAGLPAPSRIDVRIDIGPIEAAIESAPGRTIYRSTELDANGLPVVVATRLDATQGVRIAYADGTLAVIDATAATVRARTPQGQTVEDTATYLLGPVMGALLRLRGVACLHGSAVAVDRQAIVLVGPAGAGKSSTAAAFARRGHPVLSDDVLALDERGGHVVVRPGYPRVRLWDDSVCGLFGAPNALPLITPGWEKRFLALDGPEFRFQREPLPLAAVYLLGRRIDAESRVDSVPGRAAILELLANAYATHYQDAKARAHEFHLFARITDTLPVCCVHASTNIERLDKLCDVILENFHMRRHPAQPVSGKLVEIRE